MEQRSENRSFERSFERSSENRSFNRSGQRQNQQQKKKGCALIAGPKETILDILEKINQCLALREKDETVVESRKQLLELFSDPGSEKYQGMKRDDRKMFLHRRQIDNQKLEQSQLVRCFASPLQEVPSVDPSLVKEMEEREKKALEGTIIKIESTDKTPSINVDRLTKVWTGLVEANKASLPSENYFYIYGLEPGSPLFAYLVGYFGKTSEEHRFVGTYNLPRGVGANNERPWDVMVREVKENLCLDLGPLGMYHYQKHIQKADRIPRFESVNLLMLPALSQMVVQLDEKNKLVRLSLHADDPFNEILESLKAASLNKEAEEQSNRFTSFHRQDNQRGTRGNYNSRGGDRRGGGSYNRGGYNSRGGDRRGGGYNRGGERGSYNRGGGERRGYSRDNRPTEQENE